MNKKFRTALVVYSVVVASFVGYLGNSLYQDYRARQLLDDLAALQRATELNLRSIAEPIVSAPSIQTSESAGKLEEKRILPQYADLYAQNPDFYAWLEIPGTKLNYPVMYTPADGDYYLYRDFQRQDSKYGLPFIDYHASVEPRSTNLLLHGHNMKDGSMFATLAKYQSSSFLADHPIIRFDTLYETGKYEIFAAFMTEIFPDDGDDFLYYQFINADTEAEFNDYVENALRLSLYDTQVRPAFGDELLTLSTCSYQVSDGRMVVVARRMEPAHPGATR